MEVLSEQFLWFLKSDLLQFHHIFLHFGKSNLLSFQMSFISRTISYLCLDIINFDAVDFREHRSEEAISFFWCSVYFCFAWQNRLINQIIPGNFNVCTCRYNLPVKDIWKVFFLTSLSPSRCLHMIVNTLAWSWSTSSSTAWYSHANLLYHKLPIQCVPIKRKPVLSVGYLYFHARFNQTICFIIKGILSSFIWYQTHDKISMHDWKGTS